MTLIAKPKPGHAFRGWFSGGCTGTGTCRVTMSQSRTVNARFLKGPFTVTLAGGGTGSGRVTTQVGADARHRLHVTNGDRRRPQGARPRIRPTPRSPDGHRGRRERLHRLDAPVQRHRGLHAHRDPVADHHRERSASAPERVATQGQVGQHLRHANRGDPHAPAADGQGAALGQPRRRAALGPGNPNGGFTPVTKAYRVFCSGHTLLADGRLLVAGGSIGGPSGEPPRRGLRSGRPARGARPPRWRRAGTTRR